MSGTRMSISGKVGILPRHTERAPKKWRASSKAPSVTIEPELLGS